MITKLLDFVPSWVWLLLVAGLAGHSCTQSLKIEKGKLELSNQTVLTGKQELKTKVAEKALSDRIAAEAVTVADAVEKARTEERAQAKLQQEKIYALREENATAALELASAHDRLRGAVDAAASASCGGESEGSASAPGAENGAGARFKSAGRALVDGLLQLLAKDDEVTRERNMCVDLNYGVKK